MKYLIIIIIVLAVISARTFLLNTAAKSDGGLVKIADIPQVVEALQNSGQEGSFAVILIPDHVGSDGYNASVQFSISNSKLGFDWVLLAERNITDRHKVEKLANALNYNCREQTLNGVSFVRCEEAEEYFTLARSILTEIYGIDDDQEMRLIIESFNWSHET